MKQMKDKDYQAVQHLLPDSVRELTSLIGLTHALALVKHWGGTTFPISKNKNRWGIIRYEVLSEIIGVTAADILTNHYGGQLFYVPRCLEALTEARDRTIRAEFDLLTKTSSANEVVVELALKYQLSDRHTWRILKSQDKAETQANQENLFSDFT